MNIIYVINLNYTFTIIKINYQKSLSKHNYYYLLNNTSNFVTIKSFISYSKIYRYINNIIHLKILIKRWNDFGRRFNQNIKITRFATCRLILRKNILA